ncbi:MAG: hypothetical protein HC767_10825 [Akkermansiaceae bacterium]|nr:hypothetical protein [Akkermansiaceae bacterium]
MKAQAAAEAEAKGREEAARRAQMQQEAQERIRRLDKEEREAEDRYRAGLGLEDGEALPDMAARRQWEQEGSQQPNGELAEVPSHDDGSAPAGNAAGLTSDEYRRQLREVELRVWLL